MAHEQSPPTKAWYQVQDVFNDTAATFIWFDMRDDVDHLRARIATIDPDVKTLASYRAPNGLMTQVKHLPNERVTVLLDDFGNEIAFGLRADSEDDAARFLFHLSGLAPDTSPAECREEYW
jgi:hypothetical protein